MTKTGGRNGNGKFDSACWQTGLLRVCIEQDVDSLDAQRLLKLFLNQLLFRTSLLRFEFNSLVKWIILILLNHCYIKI